MTHGSSNAFSSPLPQGVNYKDTNNYDGLSKREYFSCAAMQAIVSHEEWNERMINEKQNAGLVQQIAQASVKMADALIEALNANQPKPNNK